MQEIKNYKLDGADYQVQIDFDEHSSSLKQKWKVLDMIDRLGIGDKVGKVVLKLEDNGVVDQQLLIEMMNRYDNVYQIEVCDWCS